MSFCDLKAAQRTKFIKINFTSPTQNYSEYHIWKYCSFNGKNQEQSEIAWPIPSFVFSLHIFSASFCIYTDIIFQKSIHNNA